MSGKINRKILIIDDERPDRKGLARALKKAGYSETLCVETGEEGVQAAKSFKPDVVLIDVVLKEGVDGFDICRRFKSSKELKPVVIMITGHLDAVHAEKARHSGADEIVEKDPGFKDVVSTVSGFIE